MKVKTTYKACDYITAGKEYEVVFDEKGSPWLRDDEGDAIDIDLHRNCFYLNDEGQWEIIE